MDGSLVRLERVASETQTPARRAHRCRNWSGFGVVLGYSNSERTQQNSADERKYGTHHQHIEPQSKVHVICSILVAPLTSLAKTAVKPKQQMFCSAEIQRNTLLQRLRRIANILIVRDKISSSIVFAAAPFSRSKAIPQARDEPKRALPRPWKLHDNPCQTMRLAAMRRIDQRDDPLGEPTCGHHDQERSGCGDRH
jgi:hypothetical protein